jgi:hypothetical protein
LRSDREFFWGDAYQHQIVVHNFAVENARSLQMVPPTMMHAIIVILFPVR